MSMFRLLSWCTRTCLLRDCLLDGALDSGGHPMLVLSNHVTTMDTWVLVGLLENMTGFPTSVVCAPQIARLLPMLQKRLIPIDASAAGVLAATRRVKRDLSHGRNVLLFPEGHHGASFESPGSILKGTRFFLRARPQESRVGFVGLHYYTFRSHRPCLVVKFDTVGAGTNSLTSTDYTGMDVQAGLQGVHARAVSIAGATYRGRVGYPFYWLRRMLPVPGMWKEDVVK